MGFKDCKKKAVSEGERKGVVPTFNKNSLPAPGMGKPTVKQLDYLKSLCNQRDLPYDEPKTFSEAKDIIGRLTRP